MRLPNGSRDGFASRTLFMGEVRVDQQSFRIVFADESEIAISSRPYIKSESPLENYCESFGGKPRDECLNGAWRSSFESSALKRAPGLNSSATSAG